ncbi:conserved hypothetical protein [uncultured Alphaproteobacteria bacterium]|uniref:Sce7726 family protein n=1 Tax=uncultured Alphaproteobacteria bacterium TaxID=91750 RepID=A0A212J3N5_9PROT|nr:conserved hypothetical protein [uncultured Alphaproteobacteria bacterium]
MQKLFAATRTPAESHIACQRRRWRMRDIDVRNALRRQVLKEHESDPSTLVVHELGVWGGIARVDVAVINGSIHGFEIKSDSDTLSRLSGQASAYNAVFDQITIVCGSHHLDNVMERVPEFWGVKVATSGPRGGITLRQQRFPKINRDINPVALSHLLWKEEALEILQTHGYADGVRSKSKAAIYARLAQALPLEELRFEVRTRLKARLSWRSH